LYIARDIRRMSHTYLAIHEFFIRESFQTKTPFYLECTTLLTWKSTIQVIHMLVLVPLCTCAWACTTRCVNVHKQHCEWWRSRCVNVCKPKCEWWRSRKSIYICFHMLWSTCRWGGVLGIFSGIQKNADNDLHVSKKCRWLRSGSLY